MCKVNHGLRVEASDSQVSVSRDNNHAGVIIRSGIDGHLVITPIGGCLMVVGHDDHSNGYAIRVMPEKF